MFLDSIGFKLRSATTFWQLQQHLSEISGHLIDIQGYALMLMGAEGPGTGAIVEIGSFKGKSTICLAMGTKEARREKVYAVDHFQGSPEHQIGAGHEDPTIAQEGTTYNEFLQNIHAHNVADYIVPIQLPSVSAARRWEGPIRLLFIDADHSYEASRMDFEAWSPHVVPGGLVAFHDIGGWEGVTQFYNELVTESKDYKQVINVLGLAVLQKRFETDTPE